MPKKLKTNRKACCTKCASTQVRAKIVPNEARRAVYQGQDTVIVPIVLARASVVMNGLLLPLEEIEPWAWNGVPVTIGHPVDDAEGFISANETPDILDIWSVGRIFNATVDGDKLKGEAWIEVSRLEAKAPGLLEMFETGAAIDVSTGLFSETENRAGKLNGREYVGVHRQVVPDHLAILMDEEGACNWEDGCGVRANSSISGMIKQIDKLLEVVKMKLRLNKAKPQGNKKAPTPTKRPKRNERGDPSDPRQVVADLISSESSPFVPDDMYSLMEMTPETLSRMAESYLGGEEPTDAEEDEPDPEANAEDEPDPDANEDGENPADAEEDCPPKGNKKGTGKVARRNILSNTDREALAFARRSYDEHRRGLIETITTNSSITAKQAEAMTTANLEVIANGIQPSANYSGRAFARNEAADDADEAGKAMIPRGVVAHLAEQKKAKAA